MKKYKLLLISAGIILVSILVPIGFYIWNFRTTPIASEPEAWGMLGDYIGGILNPIIGLANVCVLGFLTYLVGQQTNKESKARFILERRMVAYDEIAKFVKPINSLGARMRIAMSMMTVYKKLPPDQALQHIIKVMEEGKELATIFIEFHFTLFEFNIRHGHLFRYDFKSKEYKDCLSESKRVSEMMSKLVSDPVSITKLNEEEGTLIKLRDLLYPVFVSLRSEVETKLD